MKRVLFLLPALLLAVLAGFAVWALLFSDRNLQVPPSALISKPAPLLAGPLLMEGESIQVTLDLEQNKDVKLVNFFASYCVPCVHEHPQLLALARRDDTSTFGVTFNDKTPDALRFLERLGDPFDSVLDDATSGLAIEWGVSAIPTTFVVNTEGKIIYRHDGPINPAELSDLEAIIERAKS